MTELWKSMDSKIYPSDMAFAFSLFRDHGKSSLAEMRVMTHPLLRPDEIYIMQSPLVHSEPVLYQGRRQDTLIFDDLVKEKVMIEPEVTVTAGSAHEAMYALCKHNGAQRLYLTIDLLPSGRFGDHNENVMEGRSIGFPSKFDNFKPTDKFHVQFHGQKDSFSEEIVGFDALMVRIKPLLKGPVDMLKFRDQKRDKYLAEQREASRKELNAQAALLEANAAKFRQRAKELG